LRLMGPGSAEQRKSAAPRPGHGSAVREPKKKGGPEKPSLVRADLCAQVPGYIPTPPRATTKLFDTGTRAEKPAALGRANPSRLAPITNRVVNLTLTAESRRPTARKGRCGMDAAKPVLHNNQGNAPGRKRDRDVPPSRAPDEVAS